MSEQPQPVPWVTPQDWDSVRLAVGETHAFVQKMQLITAWLNQLGSELNQLPDHINNLNATDRQAAIDAVNQLISTAEQYKDSAGQSATSAAETLTTLQALAGQVQQWAQDAQEAAAGDLIDDVTPSPLKTYSSQAMEQFKTDLQQSNAQQMTDLQNDVLAAVGSPLATSMLFGG